MFRRAVRAAWRRDEHHAMCRLSDELLATEPVVERLAVRDTLGAAIEQHLAGRRTRELTAVTRWFRRPPTRGGRHRRDLGRATGAAGAGRPRLPLAPTSNRPTSPVIRWEGVSLG